MGNCVFDKQGVFVYFLPYCAEMVELVDTRDLKSLGLIARTGSSPVLGTFLLYNAKARQIAGLIFLCSVNGQDHDGGRPQGSPLHICRSSA